MMKNNKKSVKTPVVIGAIGTAVCAGAAALVVGLKKSFRSMKESAKAQHEVDKANVRREAAEARIQATKQ